MNTHSLLIRLSKKFPKRFAKMNHDFVGLMVGKLPEEVHKILLVLDMDEEILPLAREIKPDLIITHHPFIYGPKGLILALDAKKKALYDLLEKENLPVYSMHTNFDTGKDGMNDALSERLGLVDVYTPELCPMMRIGYLPNEMEVHDFARLAKERFDVDYSLLINKGNKMIKKVAIIGGGGSRNYPVAMNEGADIFISGDASHHVRREVVRDNYNYLDMPHEIEKIFIYKMKDILLSFDDSLEIVTIDHEKVPEVI